MPAIRIQETASRHLDDIYCYTRDRWGEDQAKKYIAGIFDAFEMIATRGVVSKPIPAEFGVDGFSSDMLDIWYLLRSPRNSLSGKQEQRSLPSRRGSGSNGGNRENG